MTTVAGWAVVGLIVGLAAWLTGPQRSLLGVIVTAALGVIGAVGCGQLATVVWTERVSSQAGAGLVLAAWGTVPAQSVPVDTTLVARVHGQSVRLPSAHSLPADSQADKPVGPFGH